MALRQEEVHHTFSTTLFSFVSLSSASSFSLTQAFTQYEVVVCPAFRGMPFFTAQLSKVLSLPFPIL